jgi:hypothetical protein
MISIYLGVPLPLDIVSTPQGWLIDLFLSIRQLWDATVALAFMNDTLVHVRQRS